MILVVSRVQPDLARWLVPKLRVEDSRRDGLVGSPNVFCERSQN